MAFLAGFKPPFFSSSPHSWRTKSTQEGGGDLGYVSRDVVERRRSGYRRIDTATGQSWDPRLGSGGDRGLGGLGDYGDAEEDHEEEVAAVQVRFHCELGVKPILPILWFMHAEQCGIFCALKTELHTIKAAPRRGPFDGHSLSPGN